MNRQRKKVRPCKQSDRVFRAKRCLFTHNRSREKHKYDIRSRLDANLKTKSVLHSPDNTDTLSNIEDPTVGVRSCKHCDIVFRTKRGLNAHNRFVKKHRSDIGNRSGAELKIKSALHSSDDGDRLFNIGDSKVVENTPAKKKGRPLKTAWLCKYCDKAFTTKRGLFIHNRLFKKHKSDIGSALRAKFKTKPVLHSSDNGDSLLDIGDSKVVEDTPAKRSGRQSKKLWPCKHCDKVFNTERGLFTHNRHLKNNKSDIDSPLDQSSDNGDTLLKIEDTEVIGIESNAKEDRRGPLTTVHPWKIFASDKESHVCSSTISPQIVLEIT